VLLAEGSMLTFPKPVPHPCTIRLVADIVIARVRADAPPEADLWVLLEEAYPFDDSLECRTIWVQTLALNGIKCPEKAGAPEGKQVAKHKEAHR
jgi:hypothetical protein